MLRTKIGILTVIFLLMTVSSIVAIDEVTGLVGDVALIGADYNVYTYATDTTDITQLTDDADSVGRYQWATWSNDGRLAYFCCESNPVGRAFISQNSETSGELAYEREGSIIIYASWSPANCGENCRELALLSSNLNTGTLDIDIVEDSNNPQITTIASGNPFYFHWDSTGTQMIFHRYNESLDIYSRTQNDITASIENSAGTFQAPVWSPVDDRVLVALPGADPGLSQLAIISGDNITIVDEDISGFLSFSWSPDGSKIAYRSFDEFGVSPIILFDADTGEAISVVDNGAALAFFWSPDSTKIAYITLSDTDNTRNASAGVRVNQSFVQNDSPTYLNWNVLDIEGQRNLSYSSFIPTYEFLYLLTYFEQFAPSHRLWSPDSRYLLFTGGLNENQRIPMGYILDTENPDSEPGAIADAVFATWSFE